MTSMEYRIVVWLDYSGKNRVELQELHRLTFLRWWGIVYRVEGSKTLIANRVQKWSKLYDVTHIIYK